MNLLTYNLLGLKPKAFGLEIENCSLKAVWLEKKRNKFRMMSCSRKILPRGIVQAEQIIDAQKLSEEIKTLLATAEPKAIRTKNVIFSIPESKAFIRTIQIPKMSSQEAQEAVKWETEANIPIAADKVYLDWQIIRVGDKKNDVLVVAVPKTIVDSYCKAVALSGLNPVAVEVDIVAIIRGLIRPEDNIRPVLIADIGAENTSLTICQDQIPYFTSSIPLSGKTFTEAVQKGLGVSWEKAENIKFNFGLKKMAEEDALYKIFGPLIENLAFEIEKSINFFNESINISDKVEKVILSGGGALLHEFPEFLKKRLNMEIAMGNPAAEIDTSYFSYKISSRDLLSYSTSLGLAIRGANNEY